MKMKTLLDPKTTFVSIEVAITLKEPSSSSTMLYSRKLHKQISYLHFRIYRGGYGTFASKFLGEESWTVAGDLLYGARTDSAPRAPCRPTNGS